MIKKPVSPRTKTKTKTNKQESDSNSWDAGVSAVSGRRKTNRVAYPVHSIVDNKFHLSAYATNKIAYRILKQIPSLQVKNVSTLASINIKFYNKGDKSKKKKFCDSHFVVERFNRRSNDVLLLLTNTKTKDVAGFCLLKTYIDKPYDPEDETMNWIAFNLDYLCSHDYLKSVGTALMNLTKTFCRQIHTFNSEKTGFMLYPIGSAKSFYKHMKMISMTEPRYNTNLFWKVDMEPIQPLQTKNIVVKLNELQKPFIDMDRFQLKQPELDGDNDDDDISSTATNTSSFAPDSLLERSVSDTDLRPDELLTRHNQAEIADALKNPVDIANIDRMLKKRGKLNQTLKYIDKRHRKQREILLKYIDFRSSNINEIIASDLEKYIDTNYSNDIEKYRIRKKEIIDEYKEDSAEYNKEICGF